VHTLQRGYKAVGMPRGWTFFTTKEVTWGFTKMAIVFIRIFVIVTVRVFRRLFFFFGFW